MLEIIKLLIKHKSLRASEIAEKLDKPYKTIERHLKILENINAIGGYKVENNLLK